MENRKVINSLEYDIIHKYYRTPGSLNQKLVLAENSNNILLETKCYFYLLSRNSKKYWAKINKSLVEAKNEFDRGNLYNSVKIVSDGYSISSVYHIVRENNIILLEYLEDYTNYVNLASSNSNEKQIIRTAVKRWFKESSIDFYDLSVNNILVKRTSSGLDIKLIDFAEAFDKNNEWCINNVDRIL